MIRKATVAATAGFAMLIGTASSANATTISVSTDVLNGGNPGPGNLADGAGSAGAQVNLIHFIDTGYGTTPPYPSFTSVPYNQAAATIDVSAFVDPGSPQRGAVQGISINSYPNVVAGSNLYLSGQPNVNNPGFGAHANWLVTLDLNVIRAADSLNSPSLALTGTFGAFGGIQPAVPSLGGNITGAIYLDGVQVDAMQSSFSPVFNPTFAVSIPASAQYLTFAILNIPSSSNWDDGLFENVTLSTPEPSTVVMLGTAALGLVLVRRRKAIKLSRVALILLLVACCTNVHAGGVAIGSSTLIGQLDYSDSFTLTAGGGETGRVANAFPLSTQNSGAGLAIENTYSNAPQSWSDGQWSVSSDSTVINGSPSYPGSSGAGSSGGMTQTGLDNSGNHNGGNLEVYGLNYAPARSNYVAQFDAVQTADWISITSSSVRDTIAGANSLSVLFRQDGGPSPPSIGLYSLVNGETAVPGATTGLVLGTWNNYAVDFDHFHNTLSIYVNEALKATVDLTTFDGGAYANYSNAAISFGGSSGGGSRLWTDNVQIGAIPTPEPSTWIMAAMSLVGLLGVVRRQR